MQGSFAVRRVAVMSNEQCIVCGMTYSELQEQWALQWNDEAAANAAGFNEAIDKFQPEIERLTKENERLRYALGRIAAWGLPADMYDRYTDKWSLHVARAALEEK